MYERARALAPLMCALIRVRGLGLHFGNSLDRREGESASVHPRVIELPKKSDGLYLMTPVQSRITPELPY